MQKHIAVIGAGIGGLSLAKALELRHIPFTVFEKVPVSKGLGMGIQLSPNVVRVLHSLGLNKEIENISHRCHGVEVRSFKDDKKLVGWRIAYDTPYYQCRRADLHEVLYQSVRDKDAIKTSHFLDSFEQDRTVKMRFKTRKPVETITPSAPKDHLNTNPPQVPPRSTPKFVESNVEVTADAMVAADGIHSVVRGTLFPPYAAEYSGCTAYRAILPYQESYRELLGHTTVWLGDDHHVVAYPNGNPKYSQQWMNLVLVRRSAQQENESWVEPVAVEDMVKLFHTPSPVLNRIFEDLVQSPEPVFKWGLYLHKPLPYWSVDKISLLGDAAHSMLPFMAQGAGMAIEDAHVLAACLSRGLPIERALALYQKLRLERTTAVQRGSAEHSDIYHASGGTAAVRNSLLSAVNNVSPHLMNQRMDWIYSYDATKSVPRQDCS